MLQLVVTKIVENESERLDALELRKRVFVNEQGYSADTEIDEHDHPVTMNVDAAHPPIHAIALQENKLIGTARAYKDPNYSEVFAHIGRVAVDSTCRGGGIGRKLIKEIENRIRLRWKSIDAFVIHSQYDKHEFYCKCGYEKVGDIFSEEGTPHIKMIKRNQ